MATKLFSRVDASKNPFTAPTTMVNPFGEVATAVNNAAAYLNPNVSAFPGHLSDYAPATGTPTAAAPTS